MLHDQNIVYPFCFGDRGLCFQKGNIYGIKYRMFLKACVGRVKNQKQLAVECGKEHSMAPVFFKQKLFVNDPWASNTAVLRAGSGLRIS